MRLGIFSVSGKQSSASQLIIGLDFFWGVKGKTAIALMDQPFRLDC